MDYTLSPDYVEDAGTGNRMHQDTAAITTAVSADDMNMMIWSSMEVLKDSGIVGQPFDASDPATYRLLLQGIQSVRDRMPFTASVAGAVQRAALNKMQDTISMLDVGGVGDGVAIDTVAVQKAALTGKRVDGLGRTYKITETISSTGIATQFFNCDFDLSAIPAPYGSDAYGFHVSGSIEAAVALTADALSTSPTAQVADGTKFNPGDWVLFNSNRVWGGSYVVAFVTRVRGVVGNVVTFCEQLPYSMFTANAASLARINMLEGVTFDNCTFRGLRSDAIFSSGGQALGGVRLDYCLSPRLDSVKTKDCHYAGIELCMCVDAEIVAPAMDRAHAFGLAYGILIGNGCVGTRVLGGYARDMRHGVTHGGSAGVNRDTVTSSFVGHDMLDACIDSHENSDGLVINGCQTSIGTRADGGSGQIGDGFISQGANFTVTGCKVINPVRYGIIFQCSSIQGGQIILTNNIIDARSPVVIVPSQAAIAITNESPGGAALLAGIVISGNTARGSRSYGVSVDAVSGNIYGVSIAINEMSQLTATLSAVWCRARSGQTLLMPKILGGSYASQQYGVYFAQDAGGTVTNPEAIDVTVDFGGAAGYVVRADGTSGLKASGNRALNSSLAVPFLLTGTQTSMDAPDFVRSAQTIASDAITLTNRSARFLIADTEAAAATDNLSTISGGKDGATLTVVAANSARDIVLKDGVGNLRLAGDCTLDHTDDSIMLQYDAVGAYWREICRSNNNT
jgi:hypothetical protein